jgi:hypothetical protein
VRLSLQEPNSGEAQAFQAYTFRRLWPDTLGQFYQRLKLDIEELQLDKETIKVLNDYSLSIDRYSLFILFQILFIDAKGDLRRNVPAVQSWKISKEKSWSTVTRFRLCSELSIIYRRFHSTLQYSDIHFLYHGDLKVKERNASF